MVGPETNSRNRGQIILIGAITLAFIVLGIVVVFNGILYTEALSSGSSSQSASDASTVEYELTDSVGGIAHYENVEKTQDESTYKSEIADAIEDPNEFADQYQNTTANSRPVIADVSFSEVGESATIITEDVEDGEIEDIDSLVGHFELDLSPETDDGDITIVATSSEDSTEVTIEDTGDGFTVDSVDCDIKGESVRFDLVTGQSNLQFEDECASEEIEDFEDEISIIDSDKSYEEIQFQEQENIEGSFELVLKGNKVADMDNFPGNAHYGAWSVDVDVTYESHDVSYERTQTINVYGD